MNTPKIQFLVDYGYTKYAFDTAKEASEFLALLASAKRVGYEWTDSAEYYFEDNVSTGQMIKAEVYESKEIMLEAVKEKKAEIERKNKVQKLEKENDQLKKKISCPPCYYKLGSDVCVNCGEKAPVPEIKPIA